MLVILGKLFYMFRQFRSVCMSRYLSHRVAPKGGVNIGSEVQLQHVENIHIGKGTYINGGQIIAGANSQILIGEKCMISYNVHIRTTTHNYSAGDIPMIEQGGNEKDIIIGNNVWIGYGAQIMSGVAIGDGSIVGAGAVVTHSIGENEVWAGVPAHFVKNRT